MLARSGIFLLVVFLGIIATDGAMAAGPSPFRDAVAVWHMADGNDSSGKNKLTPGGKVQLGVELTGDERESSLRRGGDGRVAVFDEGWLSAGQGADGKLNITGEAMSMAIRLRDPSGQWGRTIFSKYGGLSRLVYNLYSARSELGFELGTGKSDPMFQLAVPIQEIGADGWHDVVVRYDGQILDMYVDGALRATALARGALRQGNTEPCLIGAHSEGGVPRLPFRGMIDHAALWNRALSDAEIATLSGVKDLKIAERIQLRHRQIGMVAALLRTRDPAEYAKAAGVARRAMAADPYRPAYHFIAPLGFTCDPNGPIFYKGEYHLFYQFNPRDLGDSGGNWTGKADCPFLKLCWGHAKSKDLVHWEDLPIAMEADTPWDPNGVCSGNIVINDEGIPAAVYTGKIIDQQLTFTMLATSTDGMINWKKRMVIDKPPYAGTPVNWDSQVWKDDGVWYLLSGGRQEDRGAAVLWSSPNLIDWTYRSVIYSTNRYGGYWEFPYLIPIGGKHMLLIGAGHSRYWLGTFDKQKLKFIPDSPEAEVLEPSSLYCANIHMLDTHGAGGEPRRLMFGWVTGGSYGAPTVPYWNGMHSLPRVLTLENGRLVQTPVPELQVLRGRHVRMEDKLIEGPSPKLLQDFRGDALEIIAEFDLSGAGARRCGVKFRVSEDQTQQTLAYYDLASKNFGIGGQVPADLKPGQPLRIHLFLDHSVVEMFVNGRAITERFYPDPKSLGLDVFAEGGSVRLKSIDVWEMKGIWDNPAATEAR
jgi:beta-fructofuranosidase